MSIGVEILKTECMGKAWKLTFKWHFMAIVINHSDKMLRNTPLEIVLV